MTPSNVKEIERAIQGLTLREIEELHAWLEQHYPQPIDARIKADLTAGRSMPRLVASACHQARLWISVVLDRRSRGVCSLDLVLI